MNTSTAQAHARQAVEAAFASAFANLMRSAAAHSSASQHQAWLAQAEQLVQERCAALQWQAVAFGSDLQAIVALQSQEVFRPSAAPADAGPPE